MTGAPSYPTSNTLAATTAAKRDFIPGVSSLSLILHSLPCDGATARTVGESLVDESASVHGAVPLSADLGRTPAPLRWTHTPTPGPDARAPGRECRGAC